MSNEQEVLPPPDSVVLHYTSVRALKAIKDMWIELNLEIGHSKKGKFFKTEIKKHCSEGQETNFLSWRR